MYMRDIGRLINSAGKGLLTLLLLLSATRTAEAETLLHAYQFAQPLEEQLLIWQAGSTGDIWYSGLHGPLFHRTDDSTRVLPWTDGGHNLVYYHIRPDRNIVQMRVDRDYRTEISLFHPIGRLLFRDTVTVPVRHAFEYRGDLIFYGDWGRMFRYARNGLTAIENPFENHIFSHTYDGGDSVWFSGRGSGIFVWDGETFSEIPAKRKISTEFSQLAAGLDHRLYVMTRSGILYSGDSRALVRRDSSFAGSLLQMTVVPGRPDRIYLYGDAGGLQILEKGRRFSVSLPLPEKILSCVALSPDSLLLSTAGGHLFLLRPSDYPPFHNKASEYDLEGGQYDRHSGAAFFHADADAYSDLFIHNSGKRRYSRLLINQPEAPFLDLSAGSGLQDLADGSILSFGDPDNDGSTDIYSISPQGESNRLQLLKNEGQHHFVSLWEKHLPSTDGSYPRDLLYLNFAGQATLFGSMYYSGNMERGRIIAYRSSFRGLRHPLNPRFDTLPAGWYSRLLPLLHGSQGPLSLFAGNYWGHDLIIRPERDGLHTDTAGDRENTVNAAFVDLDADGDGELILKKNSGLLIIRDLEDSLSADPHPLETSFHHILGSRIPLNAVFLHYDNDLYPDFFVVTEDRNFLLLNLQGHAWQDISMETETAQPPLNACLTADVNLDGQQDILGLRDGPDVLWINQNTHKRFIRLTLHSAFGGTRAAGTRVELYRAGADPDSCHPLISCLAGASDLSPSFISESDIHFGLPDTGRFDIRISFPDGRIRRLSAVETGSFLSVYEQNRAQRLLNRAWSRSLHQFARPESYAYFLILILFMTALFSSIRLAVRLFSWKELTIYIHIISANTVFWGSLILFYSSPPLIRYTMPLLLSGVSFSLAYFFTWQHSRTQQRQDPREQRLQLLQQLLVFSHGDWGMSTLNGLSMISQALTDSPQSDENVLQLFGQRRDSYLELLQPRVRQILRLAETIPGSQEIGRELQTAHQRILNFLRVRPLPREQAAELHRALNRFKSGIRELKQAVYIHFSSDLLRVLESILQQVRQADDTGRSPVRVTVHNPLQGHIPVMVPAEELADILDNLFQNALRAMADSQSPRIDIHIAKTGSRISLRFCDNGPGIPAEFTDSVFEAGVSYSGGSGSGLHRARQLLTLYGGRIEIAETQNQDGACFRLELKEGIL